MYNPNPNHPHLLTNPYTYTSPSLLLHSSSSKQNHLTLSNQSESLLVSSLREMEQQPGMCIGSITKRRHQKRLNSDVGAKGSEKVGKECGRGEVSGEGKGVIAVEREMGCGGGEEGKEGQLIREGKLMTHLSSLTLRLQQLQTLTKLYLTKNLSLQKELTQNRKELMEVKVRMEECERKVNRNEEMVMKEKAGEGKEGKEVRKWVDGARERLEGKLKQVEEVAELERLGLEQKIERVKLAHEDRFQQLIDMVTQLAKSQQQLTLQQSVNLSTVQYQPRFSSSSLLPQHRCHTNQNHPSSDKTRPFSTQSKSKISYYLSKSNFNDTTTLGDTTIQQLSGIGLGGG